MSDTRTTQDFDRRQSPLPEAAWEMGYGPEAFGQGWEFFKWLTGLDDCTQRRLMAEWLFQLANQEATSYEWFWVLMLSRANLLDYAELVEVLERGGEVGHVSPKCRGLECAWGEPAR